MRHERRFESSESLADALAAAATDRLAQAIADHGEASLIVSGGRTPVLLFDRLSRQPLDWERIAITLADERLVPASHPASNERLVRDHLLRNAARAAAFHPLWPGEGDPVEAALEALSSLRKPYDLLLLGMGEDGHFASLFPDTPGLAQALDPSSDRLALFVPASGSREPRVSLTLAAILDTALIVVSFTGAAKRGTFEKALEPGPVGDLPIRALLQQTRVPLDVYWSMT